MVSKFIKRVLSFTVLAILVMISSFLFLKTPFIISEDPINITNASSVISFLDFNPASGFNLSEKDLANFSITVYDDRVEYTFELRHNPDDFSLNYIFILTNTGIETASQLLEAIHSVDAVSGYDKRTRKAVGYIKLRGGRGRDFTIKPLTVYEVSVTQNENWTFSVPL